ncbi:MULTISPECIES: TonB-dependent receptor [Stenotrophomonas]|uniref:Energy transducer TonB n=1 Tax=Stenotrophomonas nitritireducens TaxID=83617 RepID=A0ABR5NMP6_9GAMM|nr:MULTISPECIES: TonB-dependent receptor [Stenotrophomonas]KQN97398.1 energy transducer TonB [Stenotrophomonas sp. Leaf70]KRG59402.1 energy transducer TonB [Stenotrophomonas nitritireducens]MBN8792872.1 TonB-dependent receptor [Stenotrophomonas nitritireducens]MBN8796463.1 TonB-dependent receptor [Stenotrophomonas nitritireducens]
MNTKMLKKAALSVALGACLGALAPAVMAQSATGAIAGRANSGDQITITNTATGLTRTVTVGRDGGYRLSQLPVGDYSLTVKRDGQSDKEPVAVNVSLGGTTTVNLGGGDAGAVTLDSVQVVGSRIVNRVDVHSTESSFNINREELARMPVAQDLSSVALLAPGVISGNSSFGGISFGGSSVAENSVFINGLNVTDFYKRQSFSAAPFAFFQEFQIKTGGYSAEFGRSTGGVINAVSRSGSNEFKGGATVTFEPSAWRSRADDHFYDDGRVNVLSSHNTRSFTKTNVWGSGPIVKDRLFLFAMYEQRDSKAGSSSSAGSSWTQSTSDNGFWGTKLDWNITDNHLLELMAFSDEGDSDAEIYTYDFASGTRGSAPPSQSSSSSGGTSGSATYTGHFGENFTAKAMYGINRSSSYNRSPADAQCDYVSYENSSYGAIYRAMGSPVLGCHPGGTVVNHEDERTAKRLDFEWVLGDHQLRFGWDHELMTTDRRTVYPGPTRKYYTAYGTKPGNLLDNGSVVPNGVNAILRARERSDGGVFDIKASAFYLEDNWNVTPYLMLNLGVRMDNFENMTTVGTTFTKQDNLFSPRLGFSWDMKGDGSTKLFGNLGRYYMPIPSILSYNFAGGLLDEYTYYALDGWRQETNPVTGAPYMAPVIGAQIGPVDKSQNILVQDLRQSVDRNLDAVYQDEAILGFQSMINQAWSWGVTGTYRRMPNAMDDMLINALCGTRHGNLWPIANPGDKLTLWGTKAMGCAEDGWVTIDTSKEGYMTLGSNRNIGYSKPKRTYKSMEFQIDRAWDDKWAFNASYLWSKSSGNHEGPVNSDTNYADTGMVQHWDHPANNQRYGDLFNDHRHQIKLRGSFKLNDMWSFGTTFTALSGGPITAFGVTWPDEDRAVASYTSTGSGGGTGWLCVEKCSGNDPVTKLPYTYKDRVYKYSGRGDFGRMPWVYNLGANVVWTLPVEGIDLKATLSVYNLLNKQEVINVAARYEGQPGVMRDTFGTGTRWQSPRYAQLVVAWNF